MAPDKKTESCRQQLESHELRVRKKETTDGGENGKKRPRARRRQLGGGVRARRQGGGGLRCVRRCGHVGGVGTIDVAVLLAGPLRPTASVLLQQRLWTFAASVSFP